MPEVAEVHYTVERLEWQDSVLGTIDLPGGVLVIRSGFGSGLATRRGDPAGYVWAISDRGPNLKVKDAVRHYRLDHLRPLTDLDGAKIMPWLDEGPTLAELRVRESRIELVRTVRLTDLEGRPVSGLPTAGSDQLLSEPVFDLAGAAIGPDPNGLDTEGLVALADGGFWVGDEFGPSLVRLDERGRILSRLTPGSGTGTDGSAGFLPPIAARRQLNRGFEALAISGYEKWLYLAFQSPLAQPDERAHKRARHARIWRLDAATGRMAAQYAYPLDPPESFRRDNEAGPLERADIKVSEIVWLAEDVLLVLERGSETTKIYRCMLPDDRMLPREHLDLDTRPSLEELSAMSQDFGLPVLSKQLIFSSDDAPEMSADLEGMTLLAPNELLLVNDNDFGVLGVETCFWRVSFAEPLS